MTNKIIRAIAVVVIVLFSGYAVEEEWIPTDNLKTYILGTLIISVILRLVVAARNKLIVLKRRRLIRNLHKRALFVDKEDANWEKIVRKDEELLLQFAGTVTSSNITLLFFTIIAGVALIMKRYTLSMISTLGLLFLTIEFYLSGNLIKRRLEPDFLKGPPETKITIFNNSVYKVKIDYSKFIYFLQLPSSFKFWNKYQVFWWLRRNGFVLDHDGLWIASGDSLKILESDEILEIVEIKINRS